MGKRKKSHNSRCTKRCKVEGNSLIPNLVDFTLPGFHYLGPGSKINNGPPTNAIDAIAKKHDEAYEQVIDDFKETHNVKQSKREIEQADIKFLEDMVKTRATTAKEALGKAVGLVGIGIKSAVEKSLGHMLYPDFDRIKAQENLECSKKILAGDDFN